MNVWEAFGIELYIGIFLTLLGYSLYLHTWWLFGIFAFIIIPFILVMFGSSGKSEKRP